MLQNLYLLAASGALLACGVVEGLWTERWGTSHAMEQAMARLAQVPLTLGDWEGQDQELDERTRQVGDIRGYLLRQYVHRRSRAVVTVLLVCGRPGPIAVHSPEVCYQGTGHEQTPAARHTVPVEPGTPAEFWVANFRATQSAAPEAFRLFWSWNARGAWEAAAAPRRQFARHPVLYKLYVQHRRSGPEEPVANDPGNDFLRCLLPTLQRCLFPAS